MILLKETANKIKETVIPDKLLSQVQNSFLFQIVFLSTIKDYLIGKVAAQEDLFILPESATKASRKQKKVLVLDMDQTLVYTRRESQPDHKNYIKVQYEGQPMYVERRPHLNEFLNAVSQIFDIWVYTAGNKKYADIVLNSIDTQGVIQRRFYRETCRKQNGSFIKDLKYLKKVSKTKAELILVDDNKNSISHNYPFAVEIPEFEGPQKDTELPKIFKNLLKFYGCHR